MSAPVPNGAVSETQRTSVPDVTGQEISQGSGKGDRITATDGRGGPSHTPGPWRSKDGSGFDVIGQDRHRVCTVHIAYRSSAETEANTALIVAAPYMLEILRAIRARSEGVAFNRRADIARMVQSAIAKAEGR